MWEGLGYVPVVVRLDIAQLNLVDEIKAKLMGIRTYEARPVGGSFEIVPRTVGYIGRASDKRKAVVLAEHRCSAVRVFEEFPDYFNRKKTNNVNTDGIPF